MTASLASAAEYPIVSGFYPDPTICRVGEDYCLAHSSFEYFPGAPIFHSRDLLYLAWDEDGACYLTWKGPFSGAWGVRQGRLDMKTGEFDGELPRARPRDVPLRCRLDRRLARLRRAPLRVHSRRDGLRGRLHQHEARQPMGRADKRARESGLGPDDLVLSAGGAVLARLDGRYLSTEVATGYTGRVLGVGAARESSRLIRFAYTPGPHQ